MLNVWLDLWQPAFTVDDIQQVTVEAKDTYAYPTFSEFAKGCIDVVRQQLPQAELDDRLAFGAVQDLVLVVVWDGPPAQQVRPFLDRARAIEDISAVPSLASRKRIDTTRRDDLYRDLYRSVNEEIRQDKSLSFGQVMIAMKIGANLRDLILSPASPQEKRKTWQSYDSGLTTAAKEIGEDSHVIRTLRKIATAVDEYLSGQDRPA